MTDAHYYISTHIINYHRNKRNNIINIIICYINNSNTFSYHDNGSCGDRVFTAVCLSTRYVKTAAARSTKLDIHMFHAESWKPIYVEAKRSKVTSYKNRVGVGLALL